MISGNIEKFNSPIRQIRGKVELTAKSSTPATKTGTLIHIDDACSNAMPMSIQLSSETITDFSDVEVKLTGKNLLPYPYSETTKNAFGLEWTDNGDGSLTLNGTTTSNWTTFMLQQGKDITKIKLVPGTSYITSGGADGVDFVFNYLNENGVDAWWPEKRPLVWKETYTLKAVYLQIANAGTTFNNFTVYPQIEIGTASTAFEPYNEQTAAADANGKVEGLTSRGTPFYLFTDPPGITMEATYQKQLNADNEIFTHDGDLVSFVVDKTGEDKFFGYGISQKLEVKVRDKNRRYNVYTHHAMKPYLDDLTVLPLFNVRDIKRDENTNALTITAYDCIENAAKHTWSDLSITDYTLAGIARAIAVVIEAGGVVCPYDEFNALYEDGINVEGTESLREILNDIAEATQTIYYVDSSNNLTFKRLGGNPVYTIDKSQYFTLKSEPTKTLAALVSATELGDNVEAVSDEGEGETQYIRDNVFWAEDAATKVEAALANVGGTTITPFDCSWRGCYLLEPGDKIDITTKDNGTITTYLLNDKLTYNGGMKQHTHWTYGAEEETAANPSTLGEALKQTFAKVDKANKTIELVVSETSTNSTDIATLKLTTSSIDATVSGIKQTTEDLNGDISTLTQKVEASMTEDKVELKIKSELANGVDKVKTTEKNFTFDDDGLSISSSESNISTTITEDGMAVSVADSEVLTANNEGVKAIDLHATTYLIIGKNSRFEDYVKNGEPRTACFWIGG